MKQNSAAEALKNPLAKRLSSYALALVLVMSLFLALGNVSAQDTNYVNGEILTDTEWVPGDTYIVTGNLTVPAGVALTIPEGVTVLFSAGTGLNVSGALIIAGTSADPVIFGPNTTDAGFSYWFGINATSGSTISIDNAEFSNADNAVLATGSNVEITNSTFTGNVFGILLTDCPDPVIRGNTAIGNDNVGIAFTGEAIGDLVIANNVVRDNRYSGIAVNGGAIGNVTFTGNTAHGDGFDVTGETINSLIMEDNYIEGSAETFHGIGVVVYTHISAQSVVFEGNTFQNNWLGLHAYGSGYGNLIVVNNTFRNTTETSIVLSLSGAESVIIRNNVDIIGSGGIHLDLWDADSVVVADNIVTNAGRAGIDIQAYATGGGVGIRDLVVENNSVGVDASSYIRVLAHAVGTNITSLGDVRISGNSVTSGYYGIYVDVAGDIASIVLEGNGVSGSTSDGICVAAANIGDVIVRDNTAMGNGANGIVVEAIDGVIGDVVVMSNCLNNNVGAGIAFSATSYGNVIVTENDAWYNGGDGVLFDGEAYGNVTVTDNVLCHNGGYPLMMNGEQFGEIVVENNAIPDGSVICIGGVEYSVPPCEPEPPSEETSEDGSSDDSQTPTGEIDDSVVGGLSEENNGGAAPYALAGIAAIASFGALGAVLYSRRRR